MDTFLLIAVTVHSKAWVCRHSLAVIAGLNPAEVMNACLL
jgi:hypothetical protein